jgi:hypothetical protein
MSSAVAIDPLVISSKVEGRNAPLTFLLALFLVGSLFLLQENIGLDLADEGFLWDGAIRTVQGEIPLRDFHGYDPGRYYWVAAWFLIWGQQGIMALRLAVALFQVIGLTLGLLAARRAITSWWGLGLIGLVLLVWMFPRHKLFESSLTLAAVYVAVRLVEKPALKQYFWAGFFVGLAGFMGRNHGLYNFLAFFLLILFLRFKLNRVSLLKQLRWWATGIVAGTTPLLFMLAFVPGFFKNYSNLFLLLFREKTTNLPLPTPWPWTVDYALLPVLADLAGFFLGILFLLLPLFYLSALVSVFRTRANDLPSRSLLIASVAIGGVYLHFAFSRADLSHLAQSIHPFLLGLLALPALWQAPYRQRIGQVLVTFMAVITLFAIVIPANPYIVRLRNRDQFVRYEITGNQLWLVKTQAAYIETIKQLVAQHVAPDEAILIAPHAPALYPILQREAPLWNTYLLFPDPPERQLQMIDRLAKAHTNWALLSDVALDGRDELRFRHTHPLVWRYLETEFEPVEAPGLPANQQFLRRKE